MSAKTTVVNIRTDEYDVKICRTKTNDIPPVPQEGCFGNPFYLRNIWDDEERSRVIVGYRKYFYERLESEPAFKDAILTLKGKRLGCFCKPKACHGDVIVEYLEGLN